MSKVEATIASAISRYNQVHADRAGIGKTQTAYTEAELRAKITQAHIARKNKRMDKDSRKAFKAMIASDVAELGLRFYTSRNVKETIVKSCRHFKDWNNQDQRVYTTTETVETDVDPKGGYMFAYRYVPGDTVGSIKIEYVEVKCHPNDVFDPVLGKVVAIKRFRDESKRVVKDFSPTAPYTFFEKIIG